MLHCARQTLVLLIVKYQYTQAGGSKRFLTPFVELLGISEVSRTSTETNPIVLLNAKANATALFIVPAYVTWKTLVNHVSSPLGWQAQQMNERKSEIR